MHMLPSNILLKISSCSCQGTWARYVAEDASLDYNSNAEGAQFSSWALPGSLAVTRGILVPSIRPQRGTTRLAHPCSPPMIKRVRGSFCWAGFDNDPSAGSPTETLLRPLLPPNDKVQWTSRDIASSEPPASQRSEHFTGPFNW
ncbi:hypothetical protein LWI29_018998 [Acer saccharum]|uniref:Uncharacterized protein n=1 Tax=Acer saccharum TaxID=4024 RepID=A0AA39VXJ9_ACESA|nr:hypothetical protein LWI29_018998 [Acer saccharum]